jgi:multiple sugar transport system ATP-binding protein
MIAGLDEVTDGEITIGDRVVTDEKPKDRDIAMVFQNYALFPHMTVEQNIGFGMRLRRTPKPVVVKRVNAAAEALALLDFLARKPAGCTSSWPPRSCTSPSRPCSTTPSTCSWPGSSARRP